METKIKLGYSDKLNEVEVLAKKLMPNLPFHNIMHALEVYENVSKLADFEEVNEEEKFLLQTAALLHDVLYKPYNPKNEEKSAEVAKKYLRKFGYSLTQIQKIIKLILATKLPTNPKNLLQMIMCDSDLDNLGREDCFERGEKYRQELKMPKKEWKKWRLQFLQNHKYYTESARKLRNKGLEKNIKKLRQRMPGGVC